MAVKEQKKKSMVRINTYIPPDHKAFIKKLAKSLDVAEGQLYRVAVENFIEDNTPKK